jgi:hypothetical protein
MIRRADGLTLARGDIGRLLRRMKLRVVALVLFGFLAGCASYTAQVEPSTQLSAYRRLWVKSNLDDNHALDRVLVEVLRSRGFEADSGPLTMMPRDRQAIVSFRDQWTWDFKNHMTALEVTIQDVRSEKQVAMAAFVGPASLTISPRDVVERLVSELTKAGTKTTQAAR